MLSTPWARYWLPEAAAWHTISVVLSHRREGACCQLSALVTVTSGEQIYIRALAAPGNDPADT
eukprot:958801-Pyramimonas_sp.AAC.1